MQTIAGFETLGSCFDSSVSINCLDMIKHNIRQILQTLTDGASCMFFSVYPPPKCFSLLYIINALETKTLARPATEVVLMMKNNEFYDSLNIMCLIDPGKRNKSQISAESGIQVV